jgi:hypothetical protein
MAAPQPAPNPPPAQNPEPVFPPVPRYAASSWPNSRLMRFTFQLWVIMFLLVIVVTLITYLVAWFF